MSRSQIALSTGLVILTLFWLGFMAKTMLPQQPMPTQFMPADPNNPNQNDPQISSINEDCPLAAAQKGPWEFELEITTLSADGTEILDKPEMFVDRGGVATMIQDAKGRLIAAFQWFPCDNPEAFDKVAVMISEDDGETWSDPELIQMDLPEGYQRPFDPTLTLTEDGKIRLYFTSSAEGAKILDDSVNIYSAISEDGINYKFEEGARFDLDVKVFDSAVGYWNGLWHLITPHNEDGVAEGAYYATSEDGLDFTQQDNIDNYEDTGWTGNFIVIGDALRFYGVGTRTSGMGWTETTDGKTWSVPEYFTNFFGADPAVVCLEDHCLMVTVGMREDSPPPDSPTQ